MPGLLAALGLLLAGSAASAQSLTELFGLGDEAPAFLDALGPPEELRAMALSPDRRRCAVAVDAPERRGHSIVRVVDLDGSRPTDLEVPGQARGLAFGASGEMLYVILHRAAKRRPGETHLVRVELDTLKARKEMRLPPSAAALTRDGTGRALLIAGENEVRSILVPDLRSGPLFRIEGTNRAVGAVPGGTEIVLGQPGRIVAVDLSDPPLEDGMPLRGTLPVEAPVMALVVAADGRSAAARLDSGAVLRFGLHPLREGLDSPVELRTAAPPPEPARPVPAPEPQSEPAVEVAPAAPPTPADPGRSPALRGAIEGPAADRVVAVVLFGPDNLLNEAARVRPLADGSWSVSGLDSGRYRVQLDGGGSRALVCDPPFRTVVVEPGRTGEVPAFRVLRVL